MEKIRLINFKKEELIKRKKLIEELLSLNIDIEHIELDLNEENIKKAKGITSKYQEIISDNWCNKPIKIVVANSDGEEIATIK